MYLKNLYISGFKSFANAQNIQFDPQISAIVGPNGSGKSNISDAIRFVLGEQRTKQLRSKKMEDIIFSGTDTEGARGSAEVKLVLDCGEEPDLIISRKFYRTGESNYYINNRRVRLKDIYDLFSDTGIGKNGYSIVSQGGVEAIIEASPQQIRQLVEEATGVSGYKLKREETTRRLLSIQDDIQRLEDVLGEITKQLKPLKRQAQKTKRFLEINEILKTVDLVEFFNQHKKDLDEQEKLKSDIRASEIRLKNIEDLYLAQDKRYVELKDQSRTLKEEILKSEVESKELYAKKDRQKDKLSDLLLEQDRSEQKYLSLSKRKEDLLIQKSQKNEELSTLKNNKEVLSVSLKKQEKQQKVLLESLSELDGLLEQIKIEQNKEKDFYETRAVRINKIGALIDEKKRELSQIDTKVELVNASLVETTKNRESSKAELVSLIKEKKTLIEEFLTQEAKEAVLKSHLDQDQQKLNEKKELLNNNLRKLDKTEHELSFQSNLKQTYQAYNYSVQNVMKRFGSQDNVYGPLADLIRFPKKYTLAIQTALGNKAQDIVVDRESTAKAIIDYLKVEKKGRVTLLPVEVLKSRSLSPGDLEAFKEQSGFIAVASELCSYDKRLEKAVQSALGKVAVLEDFAAASAFRKKFPYVMSVTLDGEIFYPSGAVVGGTRKKETPSVIFQNLQIEELNQSKVILTQRTGQIKENIKNLEVSIKSQIKTVEEAGEDITDLKERITVLDLKINNTKENIKRESVLKKRSEIETLKTQKEDLLEEIERQQKYLEDLNQEKFDKQDYDLEELNRKKLVLSEDRAKVDLKLEIDRENLNEILEQIKKADTSLEDLDRQLSYDEDFFNNYESLTRSRKSEISALQESIEKIDKDVDRLKDSDVKRKTQLDLLESSLRSCEERIMDLSKDQNSENEAKNKLKLALDRLDLRMGNDTSKIFESYGQTYLMIKDHIDDLKEKAKEYELLDIKELRDEKRAIGSVNVDAVEDYNALKERYEVYKEQHKDLLDSEKDIEQTIVKINASIKEKFEKEFDSLNEIFSRTFKDLFEGGNARLDYSDPSDTLNSGIELSAQPPGKNLKHISLLSGGEKAMTAIALLFSMLELNPAPFTIIDEIDAALDDSNIYRFTNFIENIKSKNQFIIITHRKNTLRICEKINGITMASNGISKLCSIDVSKYIEDEKLDI